MTGTIKYKYSLGQFKLIFSFGTVEWYDAPNQVRVRQCSQSCVSIPFFGSLPDFFLNTGDSYSNTMSIQNRNCKVYNKPQSSSQNLQWIAIDSNNITCAAMLNNGIQLTFSNVSTPTFNVSELNYANYCQLNLVGCNNQLDLYFIGDESGSIQITGYNNEVAFINNVLSHLNVSSGGVHAGLTFFSDDAELVQELTGNYSLLTLLLNAHVYRDGRTCISCGLNLASINFEGGVSRPGVPKIYVLVTDGKNNMPEPQSLADQTFNDACNRSHNLVLQNGGAVISVAVGTDANMTELEEAATSSDYVIQVSGFDDLIYITNSIITDSCAESNYMCDSCPTGFCLCGYCQGCFDGCPVSKITNSPYTTMTDDNPDDTTKANSLVGGPTTPPSIALIVGLSIAGAAVLAGAIAGIAFFLARKNKKVTTNKEVPEKRETVDVPDRSERFSKIVRKFSNAPEPRTFLNEKE